MVTFAIVAHNEAATLPTIVGHAREAARDGDRIWLVDSASTDETRRVAARLGVGVLPAPLGKGRAMSVALARCRSGHLCFLDGDIDRSSDNLALRLREAIGSRPEVDMLVGSFGGNRHARVITPGVYRPLVRALFPEVGVDAFGDKPLSGFRAVRAGLRLGPLPPGYGVDAHLNVVVATQGLVAAPVECRFYRGRVSANAIQIGRDVAAAVLDLGVRHDRLHPRRRRLWEHWVERVLEPLRANDNLATADAAALARSLVAAARPLPPPRSLAA